MGGSNPPDAAMYLAGHKVVVPLSLSTDAQEPDRKLDMLATHTDLLKVANFKLL